MKDWNNLNEIQQNEVILNIMTKLTDKQEIWYWEGLVYSYKTLQDRIEKAIEHINNCLFDYEEDSIVGEDFNIAKRILMGSDKV